MLNKLRIGPVLSLITVVWPLSAASADPLPLETFARLPEIEGPRLSPDGHAVAMLSPKDGRQGMRVWRPDGTADYYLPAGDDQINWVSWKGNDRVVMSLRATGTDPGDSSRPIGLSRLVFVDLASHQTTRVTFREPAEMGHVIHIGREPFHPPNVQDRVISLLPGDPDHILLAAASDDWANANALLVDIRDGSPSVLLRSADNVVKWVADAQGVVRLRTTVEHQDQATILNFWTRDGDGAEWRSVRHSEVDRDARFIPLSFSSTRPEDLYVLADDSDGRLALRVMNSRTGALGEVLASDPQCDIEPARQDLQVVGYNDPCQGQQEVYFDEGWRKDQATLRRALKTDLVEIVERTADGKYALVKSLASPTARPIYWYFDQSSEHNKTLVRLSDVKEDLPPERVAPTRVVSITARDGLTMPALLTLPPGHEGGPLPFVVMPHGGPTAHDSVQYDWLVQFIANRGYGVLQPQFRGSDGYGAAFQRAGYRQWGGKMQDDVTDATSWLIREKLADAKKICIAGSSYGGYSALMGAAQHPELYQCAAAIAPVTDLGRLVHDRDRSEFSGVNRSRVMGAQETSGAASPVALAARIEIPVLLVHGRRDFTVPVIHSEAMEAALRRAGHPPEAVYLKATDHFFSDEEGRLQTLRALQSFLDANLSGVRTSRS